MGKQSVTVARDSICSRAIRILIIFALHGLVGWCAFAVRRFLWNIAVYATFWVNSANAQITPDASLLGNETSTVTPNVNIKGLPADRIDGGARRGANLFHSFSEFNVRDAQRVYFANPTGVENILTRVTGGKVSNILGTLGVNGSANLFLVNPSGILFGENAQLDVGGSFVGTTANGIQFGNQGFFSATEPESPPLLTIKPSAFFFNQRQVGKIANQSTAPLADNLPGLRVPDGRSLLLLGGEIALDGGRLNAPGGRAELAAVAGNGTIGLNIDGNNLSFRVPDDVARADINLDNRAEVNTRAGGGGSIVINTQNLNLAGNSRIRTGIASRLGTVDSQAGDIKINATGVINLTNDSFISNSVLFNGVGKSGDINIKAEFLSMGDGAFVTASTRGKGDAGSVIINANTVSVDGGDGEFFSSIFSNVEPTGVGKGGDVRITTDSLSVTNRAQLAASTLGKGDAGSVIINATDTVSFDGISDALSSVETTAVGKGGEVSITTGSLFVSNFSQLVASTSGKGDAGSVIVNASDTVSFKGNSAAFSSVQARAEGKGGNIKITANSLSVSNGSQLAAGTLGKGDAGSVIINTTDTVSLDVNSAAFSIVETTGEGKGGSIEITTDSFFGTNGAQLLADTRGKGDAGNVIINATNTVSFDGTSSNGIFPSGILTRVENTGEGNGGRIEVNTSSVSITNGAQLLADTRGKGDAGSVIINATDTVSFDGTSRDGRLPSAIFSRVGSTGEGKGGSIKINTNSLSVTNEALLTASTSGQGEAGSIKVRANSFQANNGARILTTTSGSFNAGNIDFNVTDKFNLSGSETGIFANTTADSTGNGGTIIIDPITVTIDNGAAIAVDSQGTGIGGNIQLAAGFLTLNQGSISAETRSNTGGNINLQLNNLLLLKNTSKISTTAGNQQFGGDGGNITINTPFIVAIPQENSDITANAFSGTGGKINIATNGIFGIQARPSLTELSDITASSELGVSGEVSINTPEVDPGQGLSELPADVVDAAGLINQNLCTAVRQGSKFIVTGRGGLPVSPSELLNPHTTWEDWSMGIQQEQSQPKPGKPSNKLQTKSESSPPIIEARGWVLDGQGNVMLTAKPVTVTGQGTWLHPLDCQRLMVDG
ncbi:MAG: filamentous hemagglutinin N-terminal domain-containing protein [Calothrix sp. MO_167.B12]|nr:filamentous hemagglutinin N-terminal domain-containing protein [Calothrix sp. MO_167.B12]